MGVMFHLHLIFWRGKKASKSLPWSTQKECIYLRPNTYCPGNCVYTDQLLGKHGFSRTAKRKSLGSSALSWRANQQVWMNEVLLADSESWLPWESFITKWSPQSSPTGFSVNACIASISSQQSWVTLFSYLLPTRIHQLSLCAQVSFKMLPLCVHSFPVSPPLPLFWTPLLVEYWCDVHGKKLIFNSYVF